MKNEEEILSEERNKKRKEQKREDESIGIGTGGRKRRGKRGKAKLRAMNYITRFGISRKLRFINADWSFEWITVPISLIYEEHF